MQSFVEKILSIRDEDIRKVVNKTREILKLTKISEIDAFYLFEINQIDSLFAPSLELKSSDLSVIRKRIEQMLGQEREEWMLLKPKAENVFKLLSQNRDSLIDLEFADGKENVVDFYQMKRRVNKAA